MGECTATDWMQGVGNIIQAVGNIAQVVAAAFIAFYAYRISQAQIKPILVLECSQGGRVLTSRNNGLGPALITSIDFEPRWVYLTGVVGAQHLDPDTVANTVVSSGGSLQLLGCPGDVQGVWQNQVAPDCAITVNFHDARGDDRRWRARQYTQTFTVRWVVNAPQPAVYVA